VHLQGLAYDDMNIVTEKRYDIIVDTLHSPNLHLQIQQNKDRSFKLHFDDALLFNSGDECDMFVLMVDHGIQIERGFAFVASTHLEDNNNGNPVEEDK
jgi:hypothetical protein